MLRTTIAGLAVAAALAASACGGGDGAEGTPPGQYAASVCGAISSWQQELQAGASNMSSQLSATSTPAQVRERLVEFMEAAVTATGTMLSKVEAAGPPAIDDGTKLQDDLEKALAQAETAFGQARDKAKALPTDNRAAFQRGATALGTTLNQQGTAIETTFEGLSTKYDSQELNQAFDSDPACKSL